MIVFKRLEDVEIPFNVNVFTQRNMINFSKVFSVCCYLRKYCSLSGEIVIDTEHIINYCGNEIDVKSVLEELLEKNLISVVTNFKNFKRPVIQINPELFNIKENYVLLNILELEYIFLNSEFKSKSLLIVTYLFFKYLTQDRKIAFPSAQGISDIFSVKCELVQQTIDELVRIKMIFEYPPLSYNDRKGQNKFTNTSYSLEQLDIDYVYEELNKFYNMSEIPQ